MSDLAAGPALGELIARISSLHPRQIDLDLGRMQRLLAQLDHPERRLPPVIHVAGTNGKGSTIAYLRAICEAAGIKNVLTKVLTRSANPINIVKATFAGLNGMKA